jgi:hypothetical protein
MLGRRDENSLAVGETTLSLRQRTAAHLFQAALA